MEIAIILNSGVPVTRKISADKVICADGGFLLSPVRPDYLVGDLDSLKDAPEDIPLLKHDSHKNFTDGESAVYFAKELGADIVTLYGVTGGRCDHFLGNLAVMALAMKLGIKVRSFDDDAEIYGVSAALEPHFSFALKEGERFYGGGSTSRDHIQHRGELLRMWVTYQHTEIPMPFLISSENWGVFNNTTRKNFFDIGHYQPELFNIYNTTDEADFYLMFGRSMPEIIDDFTLITGRPYLLPKWAYGLCFGPNMLENQFDILRDAIGFREMGVPCDLFWLEPQWMEKRYDFSTKKKWNYKLFSAEAYWDSARYPKKESHRLLIGRLHELGFHLGLWLCEEYDLSIAEEDALAKAAGRDTSGLEHWMDHLTHFMDNGVDGFKLDPARTIDEHPNFRYYNGRTDKEMHNLNQILLPKQMRQMTREHTGRRSWHHYTAGWAGTQHWGASTSGDNGGGRTALFDQLNLGMSGFMNTSCDVMSVSKEQEMQSLHFGLFLPWVQINSWYALLQPFYFPEKEKNIYRDYVKLRYSLMPYIYSLAGMTWFEDYTLMRPLVMDFGEKDPKVNNIGDQFMFGPALMACPVYTYGAREREVYLPEGTLWYDFYTGKTMPNGQQTVAAPYERIPLFVHAGAILPYGPEIQYSDEKPAEDIVLYVYEGANGKFTLYEDEGTNYNYEQGKYAMIPFAYDDATRTLTIGQRMGDFEGMLKERTFRIVPVSKDKPQAFDLNAKGTTVKYDGTLQSVKL